MAKSTESSCTRMSASTRKRFTQPQCTQPNYEMLGHHYYLYTWFTFYQLCHQHPLSVPGFNPRNHGTMPCHVSSVSSNLWQVLNLSLFFMILAYLKCTHQLVCRMFSNLPVWFFSWLNWGDRFWRRIQQKKCLFFTSHHTREYGVNMGWGWSTISWEKNTKQQVALCPHRNKHLGGGRDLKLYKYPASP